MMEFLLYLSPDLTGIYNMVSRKVRVVENAPLCRKYDIFGFYDSKTKILTMCTNKMKSNGDIEQNVKDTLLHESVHVAQSCKSGDGFLENFGIDPSVMKLKYEREEALKTVVAFDYRLKKIDREAFWMEDKPDKVKYVIQKYCF
jgi:hypothetical protein